MKTDKKLTIYTKVLISITGTLLFIIFFMELSNFYILRQYRQRAEELYQNSLEYYSNYWGEKLRASNNSLLTVIGSESGMEFKYICESDDRLQIETSKLMLQQQLSEFAYLHEDKLRFFVFVPEREIYIESFKSLGGYEESMSTGLFIRQYILENTIKNSAEWKLVENGGIYFFMNIYHMDKGYAGAIMKCDTILGDLLGGKGTAEAAVMLDGQSNVICQSGEDLRVDGSKLFSENLKLTDCKLGVMVLSSNLYSEGNFLFVLTLCAVAVGILLIINSLKFQNEKIFNPLSRLKHAMEQFSVGNTEVRLTEYPSNNEIKVLFETFNHMAEQIMNLKINVYEAELEKQKISNQFFRLQVQPHFYTNVLNLIYNLAEVQNYKSIQELSFYMSGYFRYLLASKENYVRLKQELACVEQYTHIQKIRYRDHLKIQIMCDVESDLQMIPPLLIQTFIENSIQHNIMMVSELLVTVSIKSERETLRIQVADTGVGFQKELLERINAGEDIEEDGKHIGIVNIKSRLRLLYGDLARIGIENGEKGAVIYINIPEKVKEK